MSGDWSSDVCSSDLRGRALKEVVTVANVLMGVILVLKLNQSGFIILITLTLLMKIV